MLGQLIKLVMINKKSFYDLISFLSRLYKNITGNLIVTSYIFFIYYLDLAFNTAGVVDTKQKASSLNTPRSQRV